MRESAIILSPAFPWYPIVDPDERIGKYEASGIGKDPDFTYAIFRPLSIEATVVMRTLSRAHLAYPESETSAIVPRITRIVMTTINSTRVKPRTEPIPPAPFFKGELLVRLCERSEAIQVRLSALVLDFREVDMSPPPVKFGW